MPEHQRNIIFFHAESWDGRMLGLLGHPAPKDPTPNIDRIDRQDVLFHNASAWPTTPTSPSRATTVNWRLSTSSTRRCPSTKDQYACRCS